MAAMAAASADWSLTVRITTHGGRTFAAFALAVDASDTIDNVKAKIHVQEGIPPIKQRLAVPPPDECAHGLEYGGRTLTDYNISDGDILQLWIEL